ncbi:MAG: 2-oxoglutarate dehydrogenase, E2 component, dihydrolipoamide succinyltransferase, partial [Marmoricola sp.]
MSTPVNLPALGESVTEGTVTRWLKQVGDTVAVDEPLLEVSTDKVDTEIPSPVAGVILEIKASEDETVEVGAELCVIGEEGEAAGAGAEPDTSAKGEEDPAREQPAQAEPEPAAQESQPATGEPQEQHGGGQAGTGGGSGSGTSVTLPALGESVTEGTVTRWLKQVGDEVAVDEPLLEVSTDKVDTEIPSPVAGTLLEIKVQADETVEVGAELAVIGSGQPSSSGSTGSSDAGSAAQEAPAQAAPAHAAPSQEAPSQQAPAAAAQAPAEAAEQPPAQAPATPDPQAAPAPQQTTQPPAEQAASASAGSRGDGGAYVTPLVRKMAAEHGVDLASVTGSGVGGRIRKQDVLAAAEAKKSAAAPAEAPAAAAAAAGAAPRPSTPSPLRGKTEPMTRLRKVIAARMVESLQTSAQLTQVMEVDVTNVARLRDASKTDFLAREGVKLTYLPFFAKAAIDALKQHPKLNANIDTEKGEVTYFDRENIAFAVDTDKGLLTPVVKDAGDLSIAGLAKKIADIAGRTRSNKIGPDELSGGTFTITNLGSFGALFDTPIINKPQVAILGPGAVVKRPVVIDDP